MLSHDSCTGRCLTWATSTNFLCLSNMVLVSWASSPNLTWVFNRASNSSPSHSTAWANTHTNHHLSNTGSVVSSVLLMWCVLPVKHLLHIWTTEPSVASSASSHRPCPHTWNTHTVRGSSHSTASPPIDCSVYYIINVKDNTSGHLMNITSAYGVASHPWQPGCAEHCLAVPQPDSRFPPEATTAGCTSAPTTAPPSDEEKLDLPLRGEEIVSDMGTWTHPSFGGW